MKGIVKLLALGSALLLLSSCRTTTVTYTSGYSTTPYRYSHYGYRYYYPRRVHYRYRVYRPYRYRYYGHRFYRPWGYRAYAGYRYRPWRTYRYRPYYRRYGYGVRGYRFSFRSRRW